MRFVGLIDFSNALQDCPFRKKLDAINSSLLSSVQPFSYIDSDPSVTVIMQNGDLGSVDVIPRRPIVPSFSFLKINFPSCVF